MRADFRVCPDACVLANAGLCDLMLRPEMYDLLARGPAIPSGN